MRSINTMIFAALLTAASFMPAQAESTLSDAASDATKPYYSGGVGETSQSDAKQIEQEGQYNLKILTALTTGHYIADVAIKIQDDQGNVVIDTYSDGPYFFAQLKPGKYEVSGTYIDEVKTSHFTINEKTSLREVILRWKPTEPVN